MAVNDLLLVFGIHVGGQGGVMVARSYYTIYNSGSGCNSGKKAKKE
jgi:hypothetical protein